MKAKHITYTSLPILLLPHHHAQVKIGLALEVNFIISLEFKMCNQIKVIFMILTATLIQWLLN